MKNLLLALTLITLMGCGKKSQMAAQKTASDNDVITNEVTKATPPAPQKMEKKFAYDNSDKANLDACGVDKIRQSLLGAIANKNNPNYYELQIAGLKVDEKDPLSTENLFKALQKEYKNQKIMEYLVIPSKNQIKDNQAYWIFSNDDTKALELKFFTRQKVDVIVSNPAEFEQIKYTLMLKAYDITKGEFKKSTVDNIISYEPQVTVGFLEQYTLTLDIESGYWLKLSAEKVADCMEKNGFAMAKSSRDSILAYIAYSLFEKPIDRKIADRQKSSR